MMTAGSQRGADHVRSGAALEAALSFAFSRREADFRLSSLSSTCLRHRKEPVPHAVYMQRHHLDVEMTMPMNVRKLETARMG